MRVRVEIMVSKDGNGRVENYEAQSILFTQTLEKFILNTEPDNTGGLLIMTLADGLRELESCYKQVPALIVLLDTGEYRVQPLVIDGGEVRVFDVKEQEPL